MTTKKKGYRKYEYRIVTADRSPATLAERTTEKVARAWAFVLDDLESRDAPHAIQRRERPCRGCKAPHHHPKGVDYEWTTWSDRASRWIHEGNLGDGLDPDIHAWLSGVEGSP